MTALPPFRADVLLVEDDDRIAQEVINALTQRGYRVEWALDGVNGLGLALKGSFDVIVTDRLMPGLDGLELIDRLRARGIRTPILVLSVLGDLHDRLRGIRMGADAYLPKPFDMDELLMKVDVLLRYRERKEEAVIWVGPIVMDLLAQTVCRGLRVVNLLPSEFKLLKYMMLHPNLVLTRAILLEKVWNYRNAPTETNIIDVHVGKLRRKLTAANEADLIVTVHGKGFMLVDSAGSLPLSD